MKNRQAPRFRPSQDVRPVTEFRAHASAFLDLIRHTKRAVILTQRGRSAAVLLDVGVYEELLGELAVLRESARPEPDHAAAMLAEPARPHPF